MTDKCHFSLSLYILLYYIFLYYSFVIKGIYIEILNIVICYAMAWYKKAYSWPWQLNPLFSHFICHLWQVYLSFYIFTRGFFFKQGGSVRVSKICYNLINWIFFVSHWEKLFFLMQYQSTKKPIPAYYRYTETGEKNLPMPLPTNPKGAQGGTH